MSESCKHFFFFMKGEYHVFSVSARPFPSVVLEHLMRFAHPLCRPCRHQREKPSLQLRWLQNAFLNASHSV